MYGSVSSLLGVSAPERGGRMMLKNTKRAANTMRLCVHGIAFQKQFLSLHVDCCTGIGLLRFRSQKPYCKRKAKCVRQQVLREI